MLSGLGSGFALGFAALADGGVWLVEQVGRTIVEGITVGRVLAHSLADLGPWAAAMRRMLGERGVEITIALSLVVLFTGAAGWFLRRDARRTRGVWR
jgi:hypothetical protein